MGVRLPYTYSSGRVHIKLLQDLTEAGESLSGSVDFCRVGVS